MFSSRHLALGPVFLFALSLGISVQAASPEDGDFPTPAEIGVEVPGRAQGDPVITAEEFQRAAAIFSAHCATCHGTAREGAVATPLTTDITRGLGYAHMENVITYGLRVGMPNWGASGDLASDEVGLMVRYLLVDPAPSE
jgi:nitrite reductase (NO-forming)/hydroxylamine reductase